MSLGAAPCPGLPADCRQNALNRRRKILSMAASSVVAVLCIAIMLRWFEHSQIYHPDKILEASPAELGRAFEDVFFTARDGTRINAWFFPADSNSPRAHLAVAYCHGNAGNISHRLLSCRTLLQTGVNVLLFDYRGYGRSEGRPSEEGTYLDAEASYEWLKQKGFAGDNIIAFGESLGGGIASELAVRVPLAGLVLQSTFSCMPDIGSELFPWLPVKWLCTIKYETCTKLARVRVPVLIMHSREDRLIGYHHAEKNFSLANEPKLLWELKGEHNDAVGDAPVFIAGFEKFLDLLPARNAASARANTRP